MQQQDGPVSERPKRHIVWGFLCLAAVVTVDYLTGPEIAVSIFYLLPIAYLAWYGGRNVGYGIAVVGAVLWFFSDVLSGSDYSHPAIPYWNAFVRLGVFLIVVIILLRLQQELRLQQQTNSRLERANDEVLRLANLKSEFTAMVSHELRTPLTALKESLGILSDGSAGSLNQEQHDFLETASRNVNRLARLVNDVLDMQQLDAGKMKLTIKEVDLNRLISETCESFELLARHNGLKLEKRLDPAAVSARADADRVTQVLNNFVDNAIKNSNSGTITLGTENRGGNIRVTVTDQGCGIRSEDQGMIFESFQQVAKPGTGRAGKGSGLGLAIAKKIMMQHGGKIGVESQPAKGSTFWFTLPGGSK
ncbi:MAG: HAMP domain-containing sensor histidine kinase [Candidatus Omnitrophota bacterium]|nr:HAMP domain-containing sensor histidine kinase [Candidatus Omnitrophota bacterium]